MRSTRAVITFCVARRWFKSTVTITVNLTRCQRESPADVERRIEHASAVPLQWVCLSLALGT